MDGCGGWLITHDDGTVECIEPECGSPDPVDHAWRMPCTDLHGPCRDCSEARPVAEPQRKAA